MTRSRSSPTSHARAFGEPCRSEVKTASAESSRKDEYDAVYRRAGEPEDVAGTIASLRSQDAAYVSGQIIYAAGGPRS
jgi:NAD(P)-dependent dehydrogenase (short-subunit alcohol dehydrogenase family)